ncbi:hypothetical protein [Flavobacterium pedocola]
MAKQKSIVPLEGTLEGINFYYRKGVPVARKAGGGFDGNAIKTKASMVRVRENSSEFGHCSKVKKQLRIALFPFYNNYTEAALHGRMMRLFQEIKTYDALSDRGKRTVANGLHTTAGQKLLMDFPFTLSRNVQQALTCECKYNPDDFTFTANRFDITKISFPVAATHMQIQFGVLAFDFDSLTTKLHLSNPLYLDKNNTDSTFSLSPESIPDTAKTLMAFAGVQFYQQINNDLYELKTDTKIAVECFGVTTPNVPSP